MGVYMQDEPNYLALNKVVPTTYGLVLSNTANGQQSSDKRWDVEFGSKGPIGNNGH
ncbi:hypothetical protein MASR1M12_02980 [Erysipelotrichia bacterium]